MNKIKSMLLVFLMLFSFPVVLADNHQMITREQAMDIALKSVPGTVVKFESEFEGGTTVYEFEISTREGIVEVEIDASTGEILEIEYGKDDDEDDLEDDLDEEDRNELRLRSDGKLEIKERIKTANNALEIRKEIKDGRLELRIKLRDCRADSDECRKTRVEIKTRGINGLEERINAVISHLEKLKERIENSDVDNKSEMLDRVESQIAEMMALKERIEKLSEDSTKEEIRTVATEVKDTWVDSRKHVKTNTLRVVSHGLEGVLERSENLKERLQRTLDRLEESGYDVSQASEELRMFNMNVDEAAAMHEEAKDLLQSAEDSDRQEVIKDVHSLMKDARDKLKEAHQHLKNFSAEVRELNTENNSGEDEE